MTAKNAILLIIKQNNGIKYNDLLSKISANYSSINSARAALSRALKDLTAFGLVQRQQNVLFATDKGNQQINAEMKNKLLLKLNQTLKSRDNVKEIDSIVEQLSVLIERSKADADLLKAAHGSTDFFISDLKTISEKLDKRMKQLAYLHDIFGKQIEALKQLNFNDLKTMPFEKNTLQLIRETAARLGAKDFFIETPSKELLEQLAAAFGEKAKTSPVFLATENIPKLGEIFEKNASLEGFSMNLVFSSLKIKLNNKTVEFIAPYNKLEEIFQQKQNPTEQKSQQQEQQASTLEAIKKEAEQK